MTQEQGIIDALATLMATVTGIVTVTKNRPVEEAYGLNQLPAINITTTEADVIQEHSAGTDERLTTVISVYCHGVTAPNTSRDYLATALGKIGSDDTLGGKIIDCRKVKRITTSKKTEVLSAEAHQIIIIDYRTPRWNF